MEGIISAVCISGVIAIGLLFLLAIVRQLLFIGRPNEVLVISGKKRTLTDGTVVGYREVLGGGRTFRIPVLEQIESMRLTSIPIDIHMAVIFFPVHCFISVSYQGPHSFISVSDQFHIQFQISFRQSFIYMFHAPCFRSSFRYVRGICFRSGR